MSDKNIINDTVSEFRLILLDRFGNPFIFSLAIAWCSINYKFFLILFSSTDINHKLKLLDWYFHPIDAFFFWHLWGFPLLTACFYVFIYPLINRRIMKIVLGHKVAELGDKAEIEKKAKFTYIDIERLHLQYGEEIDDLQKELKRARSAQERAEEKFTILENTLNSALENPPNSALVTAPHDQPKHSADTDSLSEASLNIMQSLADDETVLSPHSSETSLFALTGLTPFENRYGLDQLKKTNYIDYFSDSNDGEHYYALTPAGREFLYKLRSDAV